MEGEKERQISKVKTKGKLGKKRECADVLGSLKAMSVGKREGKIKGRRRRGINYREY